MKNKQLLPMMVLMSVVGAGCYAGPGGPEDDGFRGVVVQGISLQGISLQGISLQGISLQGISLQGISLQGISLQGISLQGISLQGISLQGTSFEAFQIKNGQQILKSGEELEGTEWKIKVEGKDAQQKPKTEKFTLKFDEIYPDPNFDDEDMFHYMITYKAEGANTWSPLCVDNQNQPIPAIPLQNHWDPKTGDRIDNDNVVSFACTSAVLAKCVEWGYRPWLDAWRCKANKWETPKDCDLLSLKNYHQACTRMARADYCGDGTPWTVNGTTIDIIDHLYPQIQAKEGVGWQIEAEWSPDGAECLQDIRQQGWKAQGQYPHCQEKKRSKPKNDCGTLKDHRALLVNTFPKPK